MRMLSEVFQPLPDSGATVLVIAGVVYVIDMEPGGEAAFRTFQYAGLPFAAMVLRQAASASW